LVVYKIRQRVRVASLCRSNQPRSFFSAVAGKTAQDAAREQGTSVDTVRTHIRRLYAKLDVNSREGLFTRLRPFLIQF
jgi:DNA-directed RNA polymerase specialized sigma24 family protein